MKQTIIIIIIGIFIWFCCGIYMTYIEYKNSEYDWVNVLGNLILGPIKLICSLIEDFCK